MSEVSFGWINWTVFLVYIFFIFVLGAMFTGRQKSTDEFFRAGKRMGWFPIMISLIASIFSAISFLGQPARIYKSDATVIIGVFVASYFFLPIFAYAILPFYRKLDITTAYEYLEKRFSLQVRCVGSGLFILQRLFWMALVCLARRDSNPSQPSDRQSVSRKSQTIVNKEVKRNEKEGLPTGLPFFRGHQTDLANLSERWRILPENTKQAILSLASTSTEQT